MRVTDFKVQLYLPEKLFRFLQNAARREEASLSAYVRKLLEDKAGGAATRRDDPLLKLLQNRKPYGPRDGSSNVDKYLYGERP